MRAGHSDNVVLLRDWTLANDFPEGQAELLCTRRMVKIMESLDCGSVTSQEFIEATMVFAAEKLRLRKLKRVALRRVRFVWKPAIKEISRNLR
jgi:hypothetical protein